MKKSILPILLAGFAIISSCREQTINCFPGYLEVNAVGFDQANVFGGRVTKYVANTDSVVDSTGVYLGSAGPDTLRLFNMLPGYDYKMRLNDGSVYFFNNIRLSGIKQQTVKRGIMDNKAYMCTERVVSYDLNGQWYNVSGNQYDRIYIR